MGRWTGRGRGGDAVRTAAVLAVLAALAMLAGCGGGTKAPDLPPVSFGDSHGGEPDAATDPGGGGTDEGIRPDDGARDAGRDAATETGDAATDRGPRDEGAGDPGGTDAAKDPGVADPGKDPGPTDAGTDPGTRDAGPELPGCGSGPACGAGTTCIDNTCETCRFQFACGPQCVDCQGTATPLCLDGACVRCRVASDCAQGYWCRSDTHECEACGDADPAHCGATCAACGGETPSCEGGACRCTTGSCGALYCIDGACQGCDADDRCGADCLPCPSERPRCLGGTCVVCREAGDCPVGQWCDVADCAPCGDADPAHCGQACAACTGDAPACVSGACTCDATSCGAGRRCLDGRCQACDVDEACGATCAACGGGTPFCVSGACWQCRTAGDCTPGWACGADGTCADPCAGTVGCADDWTPDAKKCSTAKVIGRLVAAGGKTVSSDTTNQGDNDDLPSFGGPDCWDGMYDQAYKVYLRAGDRLDVTVTPTMSDDTVSLKLYRGTACASNWQSDLINCQWKAGDGKAESVGYTATAAGWVTIVVDGASAFDSEYDYGPYRMVATLGCADAGCCCK